MGALSSWAMLALTHHCIVKIAAIRVGKSNFDHYALLGDDIVIAEEAVAKSYHYIMTEVLGVDINLSKTLVSKHSFEFAKRLVTMDGEVSPVGAKNLLVALKSAKGIPSVLRDITQKGLKLSEADVNQLYTSVPTVRKSQVESMKWVVLGPFGFIPSADGLTSSMKLVNSLSAVKMDSLLSSIDQAKFELDLRTWEGNMKRTVDSLIKISIAPVPDFVRDQFELSNFDVRTSPVLQRIKSELQNHLNDLALRKPVRRLIFDGPLVMTNFYRQTWMEEMMKFITSKIRKSDQETVSCVDPYQTDKVDLPFQTSLKGVNFFHEVRRIENDKVQARREAGNCYY